MITLFQHGKLIGTWPDGGQLITELSGKHEVAEFRDASGKVLGRFMPVEPICPWEPELTEEEIDRECEEDGYTLDQILKELNAK